MQFGARAYSLDDVAFLARAGLNFVEVDWKDPALVRQQMPDMAALQDEYGIAYLAHGPNEGDPFDVDEIEHTLGPVVCALLDLAPRLGIALYTQHLWLDPRFMSTAAIARKVDLLGTWVERATLAGVTLCIENLSEHAAHFAPALARLPRLGVTLDLGHGESLSPPNAAHGFIERFPGRIRHVHLHDNHGVSTVGDDLHLPIGQGKIDFAGILHSLLAAGYNGRFSFEVPREHVTQGREAISAMLSDVPAP